MARLNSLPALEQNASFMNLERMLARLQKNLTSADLSAKAGNHFEREKMGTNLEYARNLLIHVEQDAQNIKVLSKKQEVQADLVRKRELLHRLGERLQELNELGDYESDDDTSDGEDLLAQDTPSETTDETATHEDRSVPSPTTHTPPFTDIDPSSPLSRSRTSVAEEPYTLRSRAPHHSDLFTQPPPTSTSNAEHTTAYTTSTSTSTSPSAPTATVTTAETLLTHNRTEQEDLTASLLSMAQQLKASSHSFANTLASDSAVLDSAVAGMDRNELGLEAASRRMGHLRSMTEGKGWLGRMIMYAYIAGLAVLALVIVFVLPKLRF
ncbi:synaptobrevin protein [Rutstroemia sp. NJR-2017a BBW]|nr:synaptobrevin protein [Rutstroemia sp. NJR-2017a BBW]